jgi:hypothetical protein
MQLMTSIPFTKRRAFRKSRKFIALPKKKKRKARKNLPAKGRKK